MISRYFRFYDGRRNKDSLVWWLGTTMHEVMWTKLRSGDQSTFELVRSAGSAFYDYKQKKLRTHDFSTSLNLVANPEDGIELSDQLLNRDAITALFARSLSTKTDAYASDLIIFENEYLDVIKATLATNRKVDELAIKFLRHDNARPFCVKTEGLPEKGWVDYVVGQM